MAISEVRHIQRGTPNRTAMPRPMVMIGYSRHRLNRPEVSITVPRGVLETLPERARRWLRLNPVVDQLPESGAVESYRQFAY